MSNVQDNAENTCSYSCDRPQCIKAQRDELAAAAAQEAVAWQVGDEFYPSESLAIEAIQQWGPSGAIAIPLYAAASVTAAPGVDLEQFREAIAYWRDTALRDMQYQNGLLHEQANEGQRLLDLIDAGPKGDD